MPPACDSARTAPASFRSRARASGCDAGGLEQAAGDVLEALAAAQAFVVHLARRGVGGGDRDRDPAAVVGQGAHGQVHVARRFAGHAHSDRPAPLAVVHHAGRGVDQRAVGGREEVAPGAARQRPLVLTHDPLRRAERQDHPAVLDLQQKVGAGEGQAQEAARIDRQD
jgi:hypothetical protein